jgi:NAD(P)-dependent dehydrogenase (short-subunit alcohol dehydrogenase family)
VTEATAQPLLGRSAIVTGASRGLGREIASAYLAAGADLFLCARDERKMRQAGEELQRAFPERQIIWTSANIGSAEDASRIVAEAVAAYPRLTILVNNAGVYGPKGMLEEVDWESWAAAVAINLLGSTFLIRSALPHFKSCGYGKIIQLSGGGATSPLARISAYAASKAAIVRLVETIAQECKGQGIDANSLAPGALNTAMLDETIEAGPERVGQDFYAQALRQRESGGTPLALGARLAVFLASAASDGITGRLVSAQWDRWEDWPQHREELAASDLYTLRRITGRERGVSWGDK